MTHHLAPGFPREGRSTRAWLLAVAGWALLSGAFAAESPKKNFDLPTDMAENSLKKFSAQSGAEVLFATQVVGKIPTNPVKGAFTEREAIDRLLAGTGLLAKRDERTGALTISTDPNALRAAPTTAGDRPEKSPTTRKDDGTLVLETEVMGSKLLNMDIRRSRDDAQPYVTSDRSTIADSGATNVEDFLKKRLPMNTVAGTPFHVRWRVPAAKDRITLNPRASVAMAPGSGRASLLVRRKFFPPLPRPRACPAAAELFHRAQADCRLDRPQCNSSAVCHRPKCHAS